MRASSPVADTVEMHETAMDSSGMTGMDPMASVTVAAGATVTFQPGGMHLMLTGLHGALQVGDTVELNLAFEHAGTVTVRAEVRQG